MTPSDPRSPWLRESLIALMFLLICAAAIVTVAIPELSDERPREGSTAGAADAGVP